MPREDSSMQVRLLEAAARLLSEDGPTGLTTRRVAAEAGTSTMSVYTHFGSITDLVQAVVEEGFRRFGERLRAVPRTDDPVADLIGLARAYRDHALDNTHLYTVMFGSASLGGYRRTAPEQLQTGRDTFDQFTEVIRRAIDGGHLDPADDADDVLVTAELWAVLHGALLLEIASFFTGAAVLERLLVSTLRGLGGEPPARIRLAPAAPRKARAARR